MRRLPAALMLLPALAALALATPSAAAPSVTSRLLDRDESRAQAKSAADELQRLKSELALMDAAAAEGETTVRERGATLGALNAAEAQLSAKLGANRAELARLLAALQMFRRNPPPALLVSPKAATDAVNAAILIKAITPELQHRARAYAAEAHQLAAIRRRVALANGALFTAESDVADRRAAIRAAISAKTAQASNLNALADRTEADLRRIDPAVGTASGPGAIRISAPIAGAPIRRYGQDWPGHGHSEGWAWRTPPGAAVVSPAAAQVDYAGPLRGWGLVLILKLAGGYHLVLAGLQSASVPIGSQVTAGQALGRMPAAISGQKAGADRDRNPVLPELYLEVRRGETPQDPAHWLGGAEGH